MKTEILKFGIIATLIFTIQSCSNDDDNSGNPLAAGQCQTTTISGLSSGTISLTYNDNGTISKFGTSTDFTKVVYETNKVTLTDENNLSTIITLSNGKAVKAQTNGSTDYEEYSYNSDGYLINAIYYSNNVVTKESAFSYTNGNVTNITQLQNGLKQMYFTYSTDLFTPNLSFIDPVYSANISFYIPSQYLGKLIKNTVSQQTATRNVGNTKYDDQIDYTYVKDSKNNFTNINVNRTSKTFVNNVLASTVTNSNGFNLTYNCN